jgi:hypothetical protein
VVSFLEARKRCVRTRLGKGGIEAEDERVPPSPASKQGEEYVRAGSTHTNHTTRLFEELWNAEMVFEGVHARFECINMAVDCNKLYFGALLRDGITVD